jgi:hypothetical protein
LCIVYNGVAKPVRTGSIVGSFTQASPKIHEQCLYYNIKMATTSQGNTNFSFHYNLTGPQSSVQCVVDQNDVMVVHDWLHIISSSKSRFPKCALFLYNLNVTCTNIWTKIYTYVVFLKLNSIRWKFKIWKQDTPLWL